MAYKHFCLKRTVLLLSVAILIAIAPYSPAETPASAPLGTIVASGHATIGNVAAPTGTTIFAGDEVTSEEPALIHFNSGGRIEITKAAANFTRQGKTLVIQVNQGLLRFNFNRGEEVQISAGEYRFNAVNDSRHTGELGVNRRGQIAMNVTEGAFAVLNTANGERTEVSINRSLLVTDQKGQGSVSRNGQSLGDSSLSLQPDELRGSCVVAGGEAYPIVGNSKNMITINGAWKLETGKYAYSIVDCTEEAMIKAGATPTAAKDAAMMAVFGALPARKSHAGRNAAIVAGVGAAIGVPFAIKALRDEDKSPSSR